MRMWVLALLVALFLAGLAVPRAGFADGLNVDPVTDGIILGGGVAAAGLTELLLPGLPPPSGSLGAPDIATVNGLDRLGMFSYSRGFDLASTVLEYSTVAAPAVFALLLDPGDFISMGIVYGQAVSYALAVKNLINYLLPRYRPYMYEGGASGVDTQEDTLSFPSGHTTVAFAAATAGVTIYAMTYPDSPYLVPFAIASYGMAVLTGSLRVAAGMHFLTDVIAGAALGSAVGYLVPFLHRRMPTESGTGGLGLETTGRDLLVRFRY